VRSCEGGCKGGTEGPTWPPRAVPRPGRGRRKGRRGAPTARRAIRPRRRDPPAQGRPRVHGADRDQGPLLPPPILTPLGSKIWLKMGSRSARAAQPITIRVGSKEPGRSYKIECARTVSVSSRTDGQKRWYGISPGARLQRPGGPQDAKLISAGAASERRPYPKAPLH
jgi:hypothetical protein